jgi:Ser/Thr protein kinase RdoA (MazF antagonist)
VTLEHAAAAWDWPDDARFVEADNGLINATWVVHTDRPVAIFQRLNTRIFRASVHEDMAGITAHLAARGVGVPRLLPNRAGEHWLELGDEVWRAMTHVGSRTIHHVTDPVEARSGAALIARFHGALHDFDWSFRHIRPGAHDTDGHMATLRAALDAHRGHRLHDDTARLAERIFALWETTPVADDLPTRIIHGDLKISNLRYDDAHAVALVDLDTLAHGTLDVELGDALRSWCGARGEDVVDATFDLDIFEAAMQGYASAAGDWGPTDAEWDAIVPGVRRISIELAARFAADALNESYFGWDRDRYPAAGEHNLTRARGQAALSASVADREGEARRRLAAVR